MDFSLLGMWSQMGAVARTVVIILILMSMFAIGIALERYITYRRGKKRSLGYVAALQPLITSAGALAAAAKLRETWKDAPLARVMGTGLDEFMNGLRELGSTAEDPIELELLVNGVSRSMDRAQKRELAELNKGLSVLATIASSAPFVGLFGTVFGIITAFQEMADPSGGGGGGLATVSAGIAEALFTTAVGLAVAIVSVWLYNYFTTKAQQFSVLIEDASGELTDRLLHQTRLRGSLPGATGVSSPPSVPPSSAPVSM